MIVFDWMLGVKEQLQAEFPNILITVEPSTGFDGKQVLVSAEWIFDSKRRSVWTVISTDKIMATPEWAMDSCVNMVKAKISARNSTGSSFGS